MLVKRHRQRTTGTHEFHYNTAIVVYVLRLMSCTAKDCGELMTSHGELNSSDTRYPAVVHVSCDVGYHVAGNQNSDVTCADDATWRPNDATVLHVPDDVCKRASIIL